MISESCRSRHGPVAHQEWPDLEGGAQRHRGGHQEGQPGLSQVKHALLSEILWPISVKTEVKK